MKKNRLIDNLHAAMIEHNKIENFAITSAAQQAMEEVQRIPNRLLPTETLKMIEEAHHLHDYMMSSSAIRAMEEGYRIQDRLVLAGTTRTIEEVSAAQDHLLSSAAERAMEEAHQIQDRMVVAGTSRMIEEANQVRDHLMSSGVLLAIGKAQQMQDQLVVAGTFRMLENAYQALNRLQTSGLIKTVLEAQQINDKLVLKFLSQIYDIGENLRHIDFQIYPEGNITNGEVKISKDEVESIIESCILAPPSPSISREIILDHYLKNITKQHPVIVKILVFIILPFIINVYSDKFTSKFAEPNRHIITKQIMKEVRKVKVSENFLEEYRFVTARILNIRQSNSVNSEAIGRLHMGQLVRLIQKKKNWTLIEYRSKDDQCIIRGWVFTRYLKKFNQ